MFDQLHKLADTVDVHVIGGDIFDKIPSLEELELYFDFVKACRVRTIIFDGNHEATKKGKTFFSSLKNVTKTINSSVSIIDDYYSTPGFDIIPYCKLKEWEKDPDNTFVPQNRILCTHVRGEIPPHVKPEINLELLDRWDTVLAGDLHSYSNSQRNILYPGSPISTSFHRSEISTGVLIVDTDRLSHVWTELLVPQLVRKTVKAGEPTPATEYHHTIYDVEGDMSELSNLEDNELIGKKVVKREVDTALILNPNMSIVEEISEYLLYVLQLSETDTEKAIKELNTHVHKFEVRNNL
jgi:DNA repair exonuclease SbcCD nuclease subunit